MPLDLLQYGPDPPLDPNHPATVTHIVFPAVQPLSHQAARQVGQYELYAY